MPPRETTRSRVGVADSLRIGLAVPMILVLGIIALAPAFAPRVVASLRRSGAPRRGRPGPR